MSGGAAGSWSPSNYGPWMLKGDFEPGFYVAHFVKDVGIALAEARRMKLSLPGPAHGRSKAPSFISRSPGTKTASRRPT